MKIRPATATPGRKVALTFPADNFRGVAFSMELWTENAWEMRFYLSSDGGSLGWEPGWWSVEDAEDRGVPDVGVSGPGPDHVIVPDRASSGTYRICTANAQDKACALLTVE